MRIRLWDGQLRFMRSRKMFTFLICGRGFGKSFATACRAFNEAYFERRPSIIISPTFKQLSFSIFLELRKILQQVPVKWRFNSQMNTFDIDGVPVYGFTASNGNYENVRGMSAANLFLDEAREYDKIVMDTAIPCLRGFGEPRVFVTSSPKGMNWLGVEVKRRVREKDPQFMLITGTSYDNKALDKSFFSLMERNLTGDFLRQELYGEIIDSDMEDTLFGYTLLDAAESKERAGRTWPDDLAVIGLDCARFGDDLTCGALRVGKQLVAVKMAAKTDTSQCVDLVRQLADVCKACGTRLDAVCVDAAYGGGVVDMLRSLKYPVFEVNFAEASPDPNHYNMRAFMYFKAKEWMESGGHAANERLREDLSAQRYFISDSSKFRLLPKEMIKKALGRSPDLGDAFALTFYSKAIGRDFDKKRVMDSPEEMAKRSMARLRQAAHAFRF